MSIKSQLAALGLTGSLLSGAVLIAIHEGEIHHTYLDPVGISTACFGHTGKDVKVGLVFSRDQCLMLLATDLDKFNQALGKLAPALTEGEHIAYLSFIYNVGTKAFSTSTLRKKFLNGERAAACDELEFNEPPNVKFLRTLFKSTGDSNAKKVNHGNLRDDRPSHGRDVRLLFKLRVTDGLAACR
jgi:lysozyme